MLDSTREIIVCSSLVDLTPTGTVGSYKPHVDGDPKSWNHRRDQQRNWETMIQLLGLRAQPMYLTDPVILEDQDLDQYRFGPEFSGRHRIWRFEFASEHTQVYGENLQALLHDVHNVPIMTHLDETAAFSAPVFDTLGHTNVYFILKYR
jgi:hypothetical protein